MAVFILRRLSSLFGALLVGSSFWLPSLMGVVFLTALLGSAAPLVLKGTGLVLVGAGLFVLVKYYRPNVCRFAIDLYFDPQGKRLVRRGDGTSFPVDGTEAVRWVREPGYTYFEIAVVNGPRLQFIPRFWDFFDIKHDGAKKWWQALVHQPPP